MNNNKLINRSIDFANANVLVAGDVMLDRYWFGDCSRISPEAPVPIVHVQYTKEVPGGAANVAMNLVSLGAPTVLLSVVGDDHEGNRLEEMLTRSKVRCIFLRDKTLLTTVKIRLIARQQQVVRADFEQRPDHEALLPLVDMFCEQIRTCKAIILSDYGKGGLAHLRRMMEYATKTRAAILIDPKGTDYSVYRGATVITPNRDEFAIVVGRWVDEADFENRGFTLRDQLNLDALLVTRSEEGMSLFLGRRHIRIFTQARQVFDVSGAGDTVIATMAAAIGAGMDIEFAARLANAAAGVVVGKLGTAPITIDELQQFM